MKSSEGVIYDTPLPDALNVKVVYDTSPGTAIRVAHGGSLLEGLRLLTHE
jgi:hypothetical protein